MLLLKENVPFLGAFSFFTKKVYSVTLYFLETFLGNERRLVKG